MVVLRPAWLSARSEANDCFGAGIYGPKTNYEKNIPLGGQATVFQAELFAISKCAELLIDRKIRHRICICLDSRAAIDAFAKTTTESSVVWDCMQALDKLGETIEVTLVRVPGLQGIPDNERADELAKLGTEMDRRSTFRVR